MRYRLDREELQAMPSTTITGYHRQLGLLMGESAKQPVSLTITVLVSMGEEETDGPDARRLDQQLYISPSTADMWSLQAGSQLDYSYTVYVGPGLGSVLVMGSNLLYVCYRSLVLHHQITSVYFSWSGHAHRPVASVHLL